MPTLPCYPCNEMLIFIRTRLASEFVHDIVTKLTIEAIEAITLTWEAERLRPILPQPCSLQERHFVLGSFGVFISIHVIRERRVHLSSAERREQTLPISY